MEERLLRIDKLRNSPEYWELFEYSKQIIYDAISPFVKVPLDQTSDQYPHVVFAAASLAGFIKCLDDGSPNNALVFLRGYIINMDDLRSTFKSN